MLRELLAVYPSLPLAERKVADFVLARPREAVRLTSTTLAGRAGSSQPAVSRLCQRLSPQTFSGFRLRLAGELGPAAQDDDGAHAAPRRGVRRGGREARSELAVPQRPREADDRLLAEIVRQTRDDLAVALGAASSLDPAAVGAAARVLAAAPQAIVCGFDLSGAVAWRLASLLRRAGCRARPERDPYNAPWVADLAAGDALVVVSYRGGVPQLFDALRRARSQGVVVVVLTNESRTELARLADVLILTRPPAARNDDEYAMGAALYVQLAAARALWLAVRDAHKPPEAPKAQKTQRARDERVGGAAR